MLNKMLIEAAKSALWSFSKKICSFSVVYSGVFVINLITKKNINWMQQMIYVQYALLAFLGLTTLNVFFCLIVFIYKTKENKNTIDKKIMYLEMFMPKFERFILSIYLISVATLLKSFSSISMDFFFISLFTLVIVSWVILVYYFKNIVQKQIEL